MSGTFTERQRILAVDRAVKNLAPRARLMAVSQANVDKLVEEITLEAGRILAEKNIRGVPVPDVVGVVHPQKIAQVQFILRDELANAENEGWTTDVNSAPWLKK